MSTQSALRLGVLGAAKIARSFIAGVAPSELIDVVAVASRDPRKGNAFASELNVPRAGADARAAAFARRRRAALTGIANLAFASGLPGQITCSFSTAYRRHALIVGSDGILETTFLNSPPEAGPPEIHLRRGIPATTPRETIALSGKSGFLAEAESFALAIAQRPEHWTGCTEQESADTIAALEAAARSIRSEKWETV